MRLVIVLVVTEVLGVVMSPLDELGSSGLMSEVPDLSNIVLTV